MDSDNRTKNEEKGPLVEMGLDASVGVVTVEWEIKDPRARPTVQLRFRPRSSGDQLKGAPDGRFNRPKPGEELVMTLPTTAPGAVTEETFAVHSSAGAGPIHVAAKIKRPS